MRGGWGERRPFLVPLGRAWAAAGFALALGILLAGLAGAWRLPFLAHADLELSLAAQRLRSPSLDTLMVGLSLLGTWPALVLASGAGAVWLRGRMGAAALLGLLSMPLNIGLKLLALRPRPADPVAVLTATAGTSFPSGHAMDSAAVYGTLAALVWSRTGRAWPTAGLVLLAVGIGASRVFLGAHWAYDVVAGWAAGALIVAGVMAWLRLGSPLSSPRGKAPESQDQTPGDERGLGERREAPQPPTE